MTDGEGVPFEEALSKLVPNLRAFAWSLSRNSDRADDLVQETLIKAWRSQHQYTDGSNLKAWLFTILRNCYFSELRKRKNEIEDADGSYAAAVPVKGSQLDHMDMLDFSEAFDTLPKDQREALILVGAEGFAYEEAALMCGCAVGTMKSRVNRARQKLADLLDMKQEKQTADEPEASPRPSAVGSSGQASPGVRKSQS